MSESEVANRTNRLADEIESNIVYLMENTIGICHKAWHDNHGWYSSLLRKIINIRLQARACCCVLMHLPPGRGNSVH